ncbi:DDE superfamily endonuclease [Noviherbaspirillum humi]|uniref:DDE superfamily endonuclease n=2 Tax=Noviherbaspirillum humi TaxID=1688639 RepID=A0A239IG20_9BURK|nr:DDE superfamily endonuclease [Noviherbaspirillum humi]
MLSGANIRRVVYGCMSLHTGHRLFYVSQRQRALDFQAFLRLVRRYYRGWHVAMLLDNETSHTAKSTQGLVQRLGTRLVWLLKRAPELKPMELLWLQGEKRRAPTGNIAPSTNTSLPSLPS